jgi:nicotinamide mononucleotide transporter
MNFYQLFIKPYESYETYQIVLEFVAATFGLLSVYFSIKKNIWVYPTGIISTIIYVYLLFIAGLLGDCMINVYYSVMSVYGWSLWQKNSKDHLHIEVSWTTKKEWIIAAILFVISVVLVLLIYYYKPLLDSIYVFDGIYVSENIQFGFHHLDWANWMDIFTTSVFLVGMWLMAKRRIENWIFWILGDLISIPMYIYKGYGITSVQYLVFTVMAIIGYTQWKKKF